MVSVDAAAWALRYSCPPMPSARGIPGRWIDRSGRGPGQSEGRVWRLDRSVRHSGRSQLRVPHSSRGAVRQRRSPVRSHGATPGVGRSLPYGAGPAGAHRPGPPNPIGTGGELLKPNPSSLPLRIPPRLWQPTRRSAAPVRRSRVPLAEGPPPRSRATSPAGRTARRRPLPR